MNTLVLLRNFNNYFNRTVKYYSTLDKYLEDRDYYIKQNVNFDFRDGVNATQTFSMPGDIKWIPDYCLVLDQENNIVSKWFIMEWRHTSGNQFTAELRNDVLASNMDSIRKAPMFIKKGYIGRASNNLIFNNEGMTYSQIKKKEIALKDKSRVGWLVGYYDQTTAESSKEYIVGTSYIEGSEEIIPIEDIDKRITINFSNENKDTLTKPNTFRVSMVTLNSSLDVMEFSTSFNPINGSSIIVDSYADYELDFRETSDILATLYDEENSIRNAKLTQYATLSIQNNFFINIFKKYNQVDLNNYISEKDVNDLNEKIISKDGKLYRLAVTPTSFNQETLYASGTTPNLYVDMVNNIKATKVLEPYLSTKIGGYFAKLYYSCPTYTINAIPINSSKKTIKVTVPQTRNHLNDAPYDMFCIPYDKFKKETIFIKNATGVFEINNDLSLAMAKGIAALSGGVGTQTTYLYDLQLLPYCPIPELINSIYYNEKGQIVFDVSKINGFDIDEDYSLIKDGNDTVVSAMFWAINSSGTLNIEYKKSVSANPIERKVENETEFVRLCSPNYSGIFQFSPAKNDGVNYINVDYTYKPYNPYIHLNPDFKRLYGKDYNDSRGLVVGGDFSISIMTDRFAQYELNNKNYQQMFDREIKNMDVNNSLGLTSDITSTVINSIGAGVGGGAAGLMAGGPGGAAAGAITGFIGSAVGGSLDIILGQESYKENKAFKQDMFSYQLGNIKALPASLAKTSAFTYNNKVFPFIEEYECSEEEKVALRNKLKYNGMTVMVVGYMGDYINYFADRSFIQAEVIRLDTISEDSHIAHEIYNELAKGVYIDG